MTQQVQPHKEQGFYRLPEVLQMIPVSKSSWWAGIASGKYPKGCKISERTTAWRVEHIHALIDELTAQES